MGAFSLLRCKADIPSACPGGVDAEMDSAWMGGKMEDEKILHSAWSMYGRRGPAARRLILEADYSHIGKGMDWI